MRQTTKPRQIMIAASKRCRMSFEVFIKQFSALGKQSNRPIKIGIDGDYPSLSLQRGIASLFQSTQLVEHRPKIITVFHTSVAGGSAEILFSGDYVHADSCCSIYLSTNFYQQNPQAARCLALKILGRFISIYSEQRQHLLRSRRDAELYLPNYDQYLRNDNFDLPAFVCGLCHHLPPPTRKLLIRVLGLTYLDFLTDEVIHRRSADNPLSRGNRLSEILEYDLTQIIAYRAPELFSKSDLRLIKRNYRLKHQCKTSERIVKACHAANKPFLPLWKFTNLFVESLNSFPHEISGMDAWWLGLVDKAN